MRGVWNAGDAKADERAFITIGESEESSDGVFRGRLRSTALLRWWLLNVVRTAWDCIDLQSKWFGEQVDVGSLVTSKRNDFPTAASRGR